MVKNLFISFLSSSMIMSGIGLLVLANEQESEIEEIESIVEELNDEVFKEIVFPEAGSIIHSGKIGTADWTIDSNGTLTIGAGEAEINFFPKVWFEFANEIKHVDGTAPFRIKGSCSLAFNQCINLKSVDLSGWDTSQVTKMDYMFEGCKSLERLNINNLNTSSVTDMFGVFSGCSKLTSLDLSNWNTSSVKYMNYLFYACPSLSNLNISNWNTQSVIDMSCMFADSGIKSLDLSNWNTSSVNQMTVMFANCYQLEFLNLSGWNTSKLEHKNKIFDNCNSLYQITYTSGTESIISNLPSQRKWYQNDQGPYNVSKIPSLPQGTQAILTREDHFDKSNLSTDTPSNGEMYRLYNPNSGEHFYTSNLNEKNQLSSIGWKYEGVAWYSPQSSNTPVYRLYNKNSSDHHYTTDPNEKDTLVRSGWKDEGIGWYSDDQKGIALYRVYNPNTKQAGSHHYTTDSNERNTLISKGWKDEGVAWYGIK